MHDQRDAEVAADAGTDAFACSRRRHARVVQDVWDVDGLRGRRDRPRDPFADRDSHALRFVRHRRLCCDGNERAVFDQLDRAASERHQPAERAEARVEDLLKVEGARDPAAELQEELCLVERRRALGASSFDLCVA